MAKCIIAAKPRPVHDVDIRQIVGRFDESPPEAVPLSIPIILGNFGGRIRLIDGRKRVALAFAKDMTSLSGVYLTEHETLEVWGSG